MDGQAIGAQALGHAGLRLLATEFGGARPAAVSTDQHGEAAEERATRVAAEQRRVRVTKF